MREREWGRKGEKEGVRERGRKGEKEGVRTRERKRFANTMIFST